jgi:predicted ATPase
MQLSIQNVGKIKSCQIDIDGITIIAGNNNTGKSTVSRCLFSIVESFRDLDAKMIQSKKRYVRSVTLTALQKTAGIPRSHILFLSDKLADKLFEIDSSKDSVDLLADVDSIYNYLKDNIQFEIASANDSLRETAELIKGSTDISDQEIIREIIYKVFDNRFYGQINHVSHSDSPAEIMLHDGHSNYSIVFVDNNCVDFINDTPLLEKAIYIDSPYVIDDIGSMNRVLKFRVGSYDEDGDVLLRALLYEADNASIVADAINKKKLKSILDLINTVVCGEYNNSDSGVKWKDKNLKTPLTLSNLSAGMKMFAIIKRLLENSALNSGDFLIMDEPEIHLHPQWQIIFAEILVLLNKEFGLHLLINTHSPYFLEAMEVYSEKHQALESLRIYKSEIDGVYASISDVTHDIQQVYAQMARPFQDLENQRYE